MKSIFKYLPVILFLISSVACTSSKYIHHAPIEGNHQRLQKQYDLKLSGSLLNQLIQKNKDLNKNFQISFSPVESIGFKVSRNSFSSKNNFGNSKTTYINSWKGALGGYRFFEFEQKTKDKKQSKHLLSNGFLVDLYSGIEWNEIDHNGFEGNGYRRAFLKSHNFFLESGVQYQSKHFGIGSTLKFNSLYFKNGIYYHDPLLFLDNQLLNHYLKIKNNDSRYNFMEGSIYLLVGDRRANLYAGYTRNFQSINDTFNSVPHIAYVGFNLNINYFYHTYLRKKNRKKKKQ